MKYLPLLCEELAKEEIRHQQNIYNYVVPESWNLYGYQAVKKIRSKELIVNPYAFYNFSLNRMFKNERGEWTQPTAFCNESPKSGTWLKNCCVYSLMIRTATAWDHDRDDIIHHDNLYHLNDNGTFLKSILLLPLWKRMGINTILLHPPFTLGKTGTFHDYANNAALVDFCKIDEQVGDSLIPSMNAEQQCIAFIEACHHLGMRVILSYCPAKLARENSYYQTHPEWFYWIEDTASLQYHAPNCFALPQNTIPFTNTLRDFYKSDDVLQHISQFKEAPKNIKGMSLSDVEETQHQTIAPAISDQINANIPADYDMTIFRFFSDTHLHVPSTIDKKAPAYMLQDTIRTDLHPAKIRQESLWMMLKDNIIWYQTTLGIDGIYLEKPYLIPEKLQKEFVKTARKNKKKFAMIAEDTIAENSSAWIQKGYDAISGNSGYEESNIWNFKFHTFAYQLKGNACPMFAASEFVDSRRVSSLDGGKTLATMLSIMNQFLPNGIPFFLNGIESYEVQPLQLSEFGDHKYLYCLPKEDPRYHKQAYLDQYYFNYTSSDVHVLPSLLEKTNQLRTEFLEAIMNVDQCIPVWFDSPKDFGIGFTYVLDTSALLVVCNTNIHDVTHLHIHTENMLCELPFNFRKMRQIFSTEDPYIHDIEYDTFQNIPLDFAPGEVKFIKIT